MPTTLPIRTYDDVIAVRHTVRERLAPPGLGDARRLVSELGLRPANGAGATVTVAGWR